MQLRNVVMYWILLQACNGFEMVSFLQEAINVAAKDWGLECLRYEISEYFFSLF